MTARGAEKTPPASKSGRGRTNPIGVVLRNSSTRLVLIPVAGALGVANTSVIISSTGATVYGLVSTVATLALLVPFADLGVGASVTTAASAFRSDSEDSRRLLLATMRRAYATLLTSSLCLGGLAALVGVAGMWPELLGRRIATIDQFYISLALGLFAASVPMSLGLRLLQGLGRNQTAIAIASSASLFTLLSTLFLHASGASGMEYAVSNYVGLLAVQILCTAWSFHLLRRDAALGIRDVWGAKPPRSSRLLSGSVWMLVITAFLPITTESARLVLGHRSTPDQLASYAVSVQLYAMAWSVVNATSGAMWRDFVRNREDVQESLRLWRRMIVLLGSVASLGGLALVVLGPWLVSVISGGRVQASRELLLVFAVVLLAQAIHLPGGVLLTRPEELRWQAGWVVAMAVCAVGLSVTLSSLFGAVGTAASIAAAILVFQALPDVIFVPRMVRRRQLDPRPAS